MLVARAAQIVLAMILAPVWLTYGAWIWIGSMMDKRGQRRGLSMLKGDEKCEAK